MSEDWKAGDLAVCVDASPHDSPYAASAPPLAVGRYYRVADVSRRRQLQMVEHSQVGPDGLPWFWEHVRFRKLNDEPDDIALIERIKRPVSAPRKVTA